MNLAKSISVIYEKELIKDKAIANTIGVISFTILTVLGAYVRIPLGFTPIPITLQTFFVILSGAILGKKLGALSQGGYLILGIMGIPVFAGAGFGLAYLAGPTGGYLVGFIISAYLIGKLIDLKEAIWWKICTFVLGVSSIYLCGILWLAYSLNINIFNSILLGIVPFLPGAIIKLIFAISIYLKFGTRIKKTFAA